MLTRDAIQEYYPDGAVEWNIPIEWHVLGSYRPHGEAVQYYPTGEVKLRRNYVHGVEEGEEQIFRRDGSLVSVVPFKNGQIEGKHTYYHEDGSREECSFSENVMIKSSRKQFASDGSELSEKKEEVNVDGGAELSAEDSVPGDNIPAEIAVRAAKPTPGNVDLV